MKRRTFLTSLAAGAIALTLPQLAHANKITFTPEAYKNALANGETFMLDFSATWCGTCRAQGRVINELQNESKKYNNVKVMIVDWDQYRDSELRRSLSIPRRSTLVIFSNGKERGRIIASTSKKDIKALFDKGLS